ncbi:hypothetical protein LDO32_13350 [Luteimonas sp. Y-2-2-4F]|nr:hypothetical protein [Luteimonas sp. Y-2-2-4F]MCD9032712.1 hypothetical protein [Luteimonas sp. Y-2-2-4F]
MDLDDARLRELWQRQPPPPAPAPRLMARVCRHRRIAALWRALEVALTLGGAALLLWPGADGGLAPRQWLLIPFFAAFLAVAWAIVLRGRTGPRALAAEDGAAYARARQRQLRGSLRDLRVAELAATGLLAYAGVALAVCLVAVEAWRADAAVLFAWGALWWTGTRWLVRRRRPPLRAEYRAMARLLR